MDDRDEYGLTEHDRAIARQTAKEFLRVIQQEVGSSVISKVLWAVIMAVLGGGLTYFSTKH